MNAYLICTLWRWPTSGLVSQCTALSRQVWYQFSDPKSIGDLVGLVGISKPRTLKGNVLPHPTAQTPDPTEICAQCMNL